MLYKMTFLILLFLSLSGMRIILKDGNYIEADSYYFYKNKAIIKFGNKVHEIHESFIDKDSTLKLNYLEQKKISILKSYTSFYIQNIDNQKYFLKQSEKNVKKHKSDETKIRLETRKEKSPFFSDDVGKNENFLEKFQRKGIMIKIQVPMTEDKD